MASIYGFTLMNRKTFQGLDWQGNQGNPYYNGKKVAWYNDSGNGVSWRSLRSAERTKWVRVCYHKQKNTATVVTVSFIPLRSLALPAGIEPTTSP